MYTCEGEKRGSCNIVHRTIKAALRCCKSDAVGCHGRSDRRIKHLDGSKLNGNELNLLYKYKHE